MEFFAVRWGIVAMLMVAFATNDALSGEGDEFFLDSRPLRISLTTATNALSGLNKTNRQYVRSLFFVEGEKALEVGVRLKGLTTFQPIEGKPSFAIKFNEFSRDRRFAGLSKIFLNNSAADQCFVREAVAASLFADARIPTARTRHARVSLNGRDLGIYLAVEAMNKDFLRRQFGDATGNLYEGTLRDITQELELDNGVDRSQSDRKALIEALLETDIQRRWQRVKTVLDVNRFFAFAALDSFLGHGDGYMQNLNNYRIYNDPTSGRLVFIPHGLDSTFITGSPINPPTNSVVMRSLWPIPEVQSAYRHACWDLLTNVWKVSNVSNRIAKVVENLDRLSVTDKETRHWKLCLNELAAMAETRQKEILAILTEPEPVRIIFAADQSAPITNWFSRIRTGSPRFLIQSNGNDWLYSIQADTFSRGEWRARVMVAEGNYRFVTKVRLDWKTSLTGMQRPLFRVRLVGEITGRNLTEFGRSQELSFDFSAPPGGREVVIACEFQSGEGTVSFELATCRLIRKAP